MLPWKLRWMYLFNLVFFFILNINSGVSRAFESFISSFFRNVHTVFHSGCSSSHSQWWKQVLFSSQSYQHLLFCLVCVCFDDSHSDRYEMVSHCGLISIYLIINNAEHLFMTVGYLHFLFGNMFIQFFCPFFIWVVWFGIFLCWALWAVYIYSIHTILKYFIPFSRLPSYFVNGFLCCAKVFV